MRRYKLLPLVFATVLAVQFLVAPLAAYADTSDAANTGASESVAGEEISSQSLNEFYYWDLEKKDGQDIPVLYARGGEYNEPIKFEEKEPGVYIPTTDTLPVDVVVPEDETNSLCGVGVPLDMSDNKPTNFELRVSADNKTIAVDLRGDGSNGEDSFEFEWFSTVDVSNPESPKFVDRSTNTSRGWLERKLDGLTDIAAFLAPGTVGHILNQPALGAISSRVFDSVDKKLDSEDIYTCSYVFKDYFNTFIAPYSPFDAVTNDQFGGKLLGKKGMKYGDWLRQINNVRDYLALAKSAAYETVQFCNQFENEDSCNNRLAEVFQRCYVRAIGIKDPNETSFMNNNQPFMSNKVIEQFIKSPTSSASIWNHTIQTNLPPFATCYGGNRYTADDPLDSAFRNPQEGIQFGERIINSTVFPYPILPIDVDEIEATATPREKADTKCSLGKMGWLLCPVITFLATITDRLFSLIQQWLVVPPILAGDDKAAFVAWKFIRDFANIMFVIFLLVVVISQILGGANSAYAFRTVLPRIVVTALLINISFYLCSLLLDISNVMGNSLYTAIRGLAPPGSPVSEFRTWESVSSAIVLAGGGGALAVAGALAGLAALIPMLVTAFLSMIIVLLALLLRQSLIIILIIVAPLAFALKLLPGTDSWYKKWQTMFGQMLFLYPAIAIVFAGAYFASNVIASQGAVQGSAVLAIFAMAIQVIPLFLTPYIMKFGGGALNSFGGMIKGGIKAPTSGINKAAKQMQEDRNLIKDTKAAYGAGGPLAAWRRKTIRRQHKRNKRESELKRSRRRAVADSKTLTHLAGAAGGGFSKSRRSDIQGELSNALKQLAAEDAQVARVHIKEGLQSNQAASHDAVNSQLLALFDNGNEAQRTAAIQEIVQGGHIKTINTLVDRLNSTSGTGGTSQERTALRTALSQSSVTRSAAHLGTTKGLEAIQNGTATTGSLYQQAYNDGVYNEATVATQNPDSIDGMGQHLSSSQITNITNTYFGAANNPRTAQYISPASAAAIERIQPNRRPQP